MQKLVRLQERLVKHTGNKEQMQEQVSRDCSATFSGQDQNFFFKTNASNQTEQTEQIEHISCRVPY